MKFIPLLTLLKLLSQKTPTSYEEGAGSLVK